MMDPVQAAKIMYADELAKGEAVMEEKAESYRALQSSAFLQQKEDMLMTLSMPVRPEPE